MAKPKSMTEGTMPTKRHRGKQLGSLDDKGDAEMVQLAIYVPAGLKRRAERLARLDRRAVSGWACIVLENVIAQQEAAYKLPAIPDPTQVKLPPK